ncbi:transmembrane protein 79 [Neoarius graeffei]|uniref:transmembrane protein 79 n=1 Tax=Neoarius graeffei TaxID=443677 RepID=UPI00298C5F7D|nr:transmembrane protein 79 [Neoarius graeffei]XP_060771473.1 transmembrane protein 79 [Neoarius graeffei]
MEEKQFPVFHREPSREEGMNERQEVENGDEERLDDREERSTGQESKTESERQLDGGQETWRDEGDGSLADDEDEGDDDDDGHAMSFAFTPLVKIVRKTAEKQMECDEVGVDYLKATDVSIDDVSVDYVKASDVCTHWENTKQSPQSRCVCCGEMMSSVVCLLVGVVIFPLLVWGGHDLLPLDLPTLRTAPTRLVYTLRCALFATFPIILGVLVHGVSRLKFSSLNPLFEGKRVSRHTLVHITYVHDSLRLFLLFFVQLAVTSTYIHQDALKLIPLFTIVFVFGRLIYWPSVCFSSSVRVLGFSLSFTPVLALVGLNLYFVCSSTGEGAVFDVTPPTTPPPPKARWWG